jgi:aldehyde:ferredoxin oxidoreductase
MGDLLRIDLTSGTSTQETVPPDLVREYIGGKGLGSHYLLEEVAPSVDPLGPDNKLIFVAGPMAGTQMLGSNRYGLYFLSPQTGGYGEAYSGGNLAPQFAKTGFKVVIVEGKADGPVYLEIGEQGATIHPAGDLWGLDAYEAEDAIVARTHPKAQACVIGPAGEKLVRFACIDNNKWHQLGRGGCGAVMGSKHLKGIVWHGERKVEVARPDEFKALVKDLVGRCKDDPGAAAYQRGGTMNMVRIMNGQNAFPTRYWRKGTVDDFERITVETMLEEHGTKNEVCPPCVFKCVKHNHVFKGRHEGLEIEGPEYETAYVFGGLCEIVDLSEIMWLNDICDRLGVDSMSAGNLCALAIECSRRGLIDEKLDFGDAEGVGDFLTRMSLRDGEVPSLFADGILAIEEAIPEIKGIAVHVKGMEPAGYDPRVSKGMALGYITAARGACHLRATIMKAEFSGLIPIDAVEGKAAVYVEWEDRLAMMDALIFCRFYRDFTQWPFLTSVVNAALGTDHDEATMRRLGAEMVTLSHRFNERRGFGRDKERLPAWVTERPLYDRDGKEQLTTAAELDTMLREYYEVRGWGQPPA